LLFYDASDGTGEFYTVDNHGGMSLLQSHSWNTTWTQIIPGNFGGSSRGLTDLLFYDATNGIGSFWVNDGVGRIRNIADHTNWRQTWTRIVPGNFGGAVIPWHNYTDLLFYDAASGTGEFYATDGNGNLTDGRGGFGPLGQHTNWRTTWTQIIPGNFGGSGRTDLLFYDPSSGTGEFYTTDGSGGMTLLQAHTNWRTTWAQIIPGQFGGDEYTDLLFYDPTAQPTAIGEFYKTDGHGGISILTQNTGWERDWQIIPGVYAPNLGIRVHVKILKDPRLGIVDLINAMRQVFAKAGIRVTVGSTQTISNRPDLLAVDVGNCYSGLLQHGDILRASCGSCPSSEAAPETKILFCISSPPYLAISLIAAMAVRSTGTGNQERSSRVERTSGLLRMKLVTFSVSITSTTTPTTPNT
jgi:hypothetical protein